MKELSWSKEVKNNIMRDLHGDTTLGDITSFDLICS